MSEFDPSFTDLTSADKFNVIVSDAFMFYSCLDLWIQIAMEISSHSCLWNSNHNCQVKH